MAVSLPSDPDPYLSTPSSTFFLAQSPSVEFLSIEINALDNIIRILTTKHDHLVSLRVSLSDVK
jgi:hypothetical protein